MLTTLKPRVYMESVGGTTVVSFADTDLTSEAVIAEVGDQLRLIDGSRLSQVVLSFRDVQLMSSTMLAVLLGFSRRVAAAGGRLKLSGIAPDLLVVFRITRFDRIFEIYPDDPSALDSF